uniref:Uncharacterized protein n=1 Tax=Avena sativa TaxID=4498 RepID=A0ACD5U8J5_AVESA
MAGVVEHGGELAALREALRQQSLAVEMLKVELEEERQAASTGADEALAMILRLQAEKAAERMESVQFRRVAEERIRHDEDSMAFLRAVVFSQEMDISSLKNRLLSVCGSNDPYIPPSGGDGAFDLPWLRRLARNGVLSRRNASLPAARLEELCSDIGAAAGGGEDGDVRPTRTVSDIGEVIRREKEWVRSNVSHKAPPRLHRSASYHLRRVPSYSAQSGMHLPAGNVVDKRNTSSEDGSSSKEVNLPHGELLMKHFIEVCAIISSALLARPLLASMSFFRCFLIFVIAVVFTRILMSSYLQ